MTAERLAARLGHRVARDALARTVRDAARDGGAAVWLVGGYVRDAALGRPAHDLDLVAGAGVSRLLAALRRAWSTRGFRFRKRGVTTWRFEVAGRRVDLVDASRRGLAADLRRRELTINAVAYDLLGRRVEDPLHGLRDLRGGRLRRPRAGVMREDPLRGLRAARFLAQLPGFAVERATRAEIERAAPALRRAAVERVREELERLLAARSPERGLAAVERWGLLEPLLPELAPLPGCTAGRDRPDVWRHTVLAIARSGRSARLPGAAAARAAEPRAVLRWALLLHDVSKPETLRRAADGRPTFHGHEVLGARRAERILRRLRASRELRRRVVRLVRLHLRPGHLADADRPPRGMRRLVRDAGDDLPLLVLHAACDAQASGAPDAARRWRRLRRTLIELQRLAASATGAAGSPLIDGHDVMRAARIAPGPRVGEILERVRDARLAGTLSTREQALALAARLGPGRRRGARH